MSNLPFERTCSPTAAESETTPPVLEVRRKLFCFTPWRRYRKLGLVLRGAICAGSEDTSSDYDTYFTVLQARLATSVSLLSRNLTCESVPLRLVRFDKCTRPNAVQAILKSCLGSLLISHTLVAVLLSSPGSTSKYCWLRSIYAFRLFVFLLLLQRTHIHKYRQLHPHLSCKNQRDTDHISITIN